MKRSVVMMVIALLVCVVRLQAQGTATIDGTVVDSTQAAVPKAVVTLTETQTGRTRTIDSSQLGYFTFTSLGPGTYTLKVSLSGFKTWQRQDIVLNVAQHATFRPVLEVGNITQTVQVTAATPLVTTSSSTLASVVNSAQIQRLPLNGRNALQLVSLTPGVVSTGTTGQFGVVQPSFASSGGRDIDINYFLDGGTNINPFYAQPINFPDPNALLEFSVLNRNYSAEYGRGSTIVSAVTRPGTNEFHGSLFEFLRNTSLDARPFFSADRPSYKRNQFGGTFGGPIRKNKAFFFVSYQGTQVRGAPGSRTYTTMTVAERTGDFSALSKQIIDPTTGQPFQGNIIPPNRIEQQATNFINQFLPPANLGQNAYTYTVANQLSENQIIGKVDYGLSQKDNLSVRYLFDNLPQIGVYGSGLDPTWKASLPARYQSATADYTHTFSPTLLNDANLTYVRSAFGEVNLTDFTLSALGYPVNNGNASSSFGLTPDSEIALGGYFSVYLGAPTRDIMPTWYFHDNLSWVHNIHSINVGMELYHNRVNELQNFFTGGALTFSGQFSGDGAADFLLGNFSSYRQIMVLTSRLHQTLPSIYVQDNIKLSRRVTLNAGLRWDPVAGYQSEDKQLSTYLPGDQSRLFPLAASGLLYPGDNGLPQNIVGTRYTNIAPRVGVAWDVFGNGKTSIRAGGGIYYIPLTRGITFNRFTLIQPFTVDLSVNGGTASDIWAGPPYNGVNPFPRPTAGDLSGLQALPFVPFAGESSLSLPFKTEADNQWSLSVQQALWKNAVLEVNYVGSSSSHLTTSYDRNHAVYIPGASTVGNTQSRRIDPQIGAINAIGDVLTSNYNALQFSFRQRYSHGLSVNSYYTYSKTLGIVGSEGEGSNGPRDPYNFGLNYGPMSYDIRNNWVTDFLWQPTEHRKFSNRMVGAVAGGWGLTSIFTVQSGPPLTLASGVDNSFTGIGGDTPNQVGAWQLSGSRSKGQQIQQWFNTQAFVPNPPGTFGTLGEGALRSPGYWNWDAAVLRTFVPHEGYQLEFRGSFYNILNHANLGAPVNSLTSPAFGEILSTTTPRQIEFSLNLQF
jgi:Carboxypeptidase regulatory-like domain